MKVRVKICGLTNLDDALCAVDAGADMLGFIFTDKSPRYVPHQKALTLVSEIKEVCRNTGQAVPHLIGVFVNEAPDAVASTLDAVGLDYAQLHGSESSGMLAQLHGRAFKAIRPKAGSGTGTDADARAYAALGVSEGPRLLVDAYSPDAYGGTGELSNWTYAAHLASQLDGLMLAGGLTPENVGAAIREVRPWAVDTGSGVESELGRKSHEAIRTFVSSVKRLD